MLTLNKAAINMLNLADFDEFDIFKLRELTDGNEMLSLLPWLLSKRNCFAKVELDLQRLVQFTVKIQDGYKNITYHNKTHGADLCQTLN